MAYAPQAANVANQVFAGSEAALRAQQQMAASKTAADIAALQGLQQTGAGQIDESYKGLFGDLSRNRAGAIENINNAAQAMGAAHNQGFESAALAQQESRNYLEEMAQRIGGQSVADRMPLAQGAQEQTFNRIGEINRNRAQSLLDAFNVWGTQQDTEFGRTEDIMRGRQAMDIKDFNANLGQQMSQAQMAGREQQLAALTALAELGTQKGQMGTSLAMQMAGLDQRSQEANARFAAQADELGFRREQANLDRIMQQRQIDQQGGVDPWEKEKFYASLGLDRDKLNSRNSQWAAEFGNQPQDPYEAMEGMRRYAADQGIDPRAADQILRQFSSAQGSNDWLMQAARGKDPLAYMIDNYTKYNPTGNPGYSQDRAALNRGQWNDMLGILLGGY